MKTTDTEMLKSNGQGVGAGLSDPEVVPKARRRQFTSAYKLRIVREAEKCHAKGELGALLRREGLYSSHLALWRKQVGAGSSRALSKKRGKSKKSAVELENERLRKQVRRLERRLKKAETVIDVQKKLSEMLGIELPKTDDIESD